MNKYIKQSRINFRKLLLDFKNPHFKVVLKPYPKNHGYVYFEGDNYSGIILKEEMEDIIGSINAYSKVFKMNNGENHKWQLSIGVDYIITYPAKLN